MAKLGSTLKLICRTSYKLQS